jgi:phospholipid-binding lipoprotein MlaA
LTSRRRAPARGALEVLRPRAARSLLAVALLAVLASCGPATLPPGDRVVDTREARNREVHRFNADLDRAVIAPAAEVYGAAVPEPLRRGIGNFSDNLGQPGNVLNNLLQARVGEAVQNTVRFALNTTIGIGGLFDPATAMGVPAAPTDFGETLHVYGFGEGTYRVVPVFGPTTTRDSVGRVVDIVLNPLRHVGGISQAQYVAGVAGTGVLDGLDARRDLANTIDGIYASPDGYALARSLYLQNRRHELRRGSESVRAEPDAGLDPYDDPYFDPYSQ